MDTKLLKFNFLKSPDEQKKFIALVLGAIIFIALGWKLAIEPVQAKVFASRQAARTAHERSEIISEIHKLNKTLNSLEVQLQNEKDRHLVLGEVTKLANSNSVSIESMTPTTDPKGSYSRLEISLKAIGTFKSLLDFLLATEAAKGNITVSRISLSSQRSYGYDASGGVSQIPSAEIGLETYLKKGPK